MCLKKRSDLNGLERRTGKVVLHQDGMCEGGPSNRLKAQAGWCSREPGPA